MKSNLNFAAAARLRTLALVAAILSPGMVIAKPDSSIHGDSPKSSAPKLRSVQKPIPFNRPAPSAIRFNSIDGQPLQ